MSYKLQSLKFFSLQNRVESHRAFKNELEAVSKQLLSISIDAQPINAFSGKTGTGNSNEDSRRHKQAGKKNPKNFLSIHQRAQPQGNRAAPEKRYGGSILLF